MNGRIPTKGLSCARGRVFSLGLLAFAISAKLAQGQDVAEAARQEQARKSAEHKTPPHVYTTEELKQKKILTSEDQARAEAHKQNPGQPATEQNAESLPVELNPQPESLGAIARRFQEAKAARDAEEAAKKNFTPFPYDIPAPTVAAPAPGIIARRSAVASTDSSNRSTSKPASNSLLAKSGTTAARRVSPFEPRPLRTAPRTLPEIVLTRPVERADVEPRLNPSVPSFEKAATQRVEVRRGESWWKLAKQYLGSGSRWPELRRLNGKMNGPAELLLSETVVVVPVSSNHRAVSPSGRITVEPKDSLWKLARGHLGRGSEWTCLAQANPQITDYLHLAVGTSLEMPTAAALEACREDSRGKSQK